jgi:RNA polymerase sigma factor (sigma-70 family)
MLAVPEAQLGSVCFDDRYIEGLRGWNAEAEAQFVAYFRVPIWLKARRQLRAPDLVEDACQETLLRVLRYFRSGKGLDNPERLPAFVHSVCHNVTLEMIRTRTRYAQIPENGYDCADMRDDAFQDVVTDERKKRVRQILAKLSKKDRDLLRLAVLEEKDKQELCQRFGTNEDYLRVLLHRARMRFRAAHLKLQRSEEHRKTELS